MHVPFPESSIPFVTTVVAETRGLITAFKMLPSGSGSFWQEMKRHTNAMTDIRACILFIFICRFFLEVEIHIKSIRWKYGVIFEPFYFDLIIFNADADVGASEDALFYLSHDRGHSCLFIKEFASCGIAATNPLRYVRLTGMPGHLFSFNCHNHKFIFVYYLIE